MTVKHEITDRPVEDLSKAALVAEWNEAYEQLQSGTALDRDSVWDRRRELWTEMRNRTDAEPPECPECGGDRWKQSMGGPKHCSDCGLALGEDHAELIQAIDSYWSSVQAAEVVSTDGGQTVDENGTVRADSVEDVSEHTNSETCSYDCEDEADYDVTMRRNSREATFPACHSCAVDNGVRPGDWDV
ncbi:unknown (plasmid) [Haloarcula marismortui ATCC 43049]|uniref:Uncharacterized protein n=1 Tax=Haloarcula marismortui (strain ATCC 43049 / DSM 3752 / JCM 8966 / VKM B-1809) TaxID=272569 RepID=Q5V7Z0_HALMA|nr:hypothetical protein [Haloarcula marismortui]AAV44352.1 unknown [Haloarcula marismortui ATCC 43049]